MIPKLKVSCKGLVPVLLASMLFGNTACNKMLDKASTHVASETLQWKTLSDTRSALIGIYGLFRAALADNNAHWMYGEMRFGDFKAYKQADLALIGDNRLDASFPLLQDLSNWRRFYAVVNAAAVLIEHAPQVRLADVRYSEQNLIYDIAQARALRAFAYFYMVRIWGDVPLITEAYDNGSFPKKPQTDYRQVLAYAENELLAVVNDLPYLYGTNGQSYYGENENIWNGVLFNKMAAYSVLAHIAAWQGNYVNTEVYTRFITENYTGAGLHFPI